MDVPFLALDSAEQRDKLAITVTVETGLSVLEGTQHQVGEGASESNGIVERGGGEDVFARLNLVLTAVGQDAVGAQVVQLLLSQDGVESFEDVVFEDRASDAVAVVVAGDVVDQAGEEGDLEDFVEGDEL